mmetsp:Transcript_2628/g.6149  ORF Transcript_2628/g.6149 Transcript_2628/m.6149 type:complete len:205 (-) Transcript_2628:782-1396(-)
MPYAFHTWRQSFTTTSRIGQPRQPDRTAQIILPRPSLLQEPHIIPADSATTTSIEEVEDRIPWLRALRLPAKRVEVVAGELLAGSESFGETFQIPHEGRTELKEKLKALRVHVAIADGLPVFPELFRLPQRRTLGRQQRIEEELRTAPVPCGRQSLDELGARKNIFALVVDGFPGAEHVAEPSHEHLPEGTDRVPCLRFRLYAL